jgi:putative Mg2+ transporter-C (MgtC) family protein
MVVAVGAALIMLVSVDISLQHKTVTDPSRIAAQVVSGIGFLGAGAILRFGMSVKGLTTAACLWAASGIGLAVGIGYYKGALAATGFVLLATFVFDHIEKMLIIGRTYKQFVITARDSAGLVGRVEAAMETRGIVIKQVGVTRDLVEKKAQVTVTAVVPRSLDLGGISDDISAQAGVERVEIN